MKVKGHQIVDLTQENMFIETNTILVNDSVTNKEYVVTKLNTGINTIHQAIVLNMGMTCNNATSGQRASDLAVVEFPISNIMVELNGVLINVGDGLDCFFSPDGIIKRTGGEAQKADYLYWTGDYDLDDTDQISFIYLVAYDHFVLGAGTTAYLQPINNTVVVKYTGDLGTTMNVDLDNTLVTVGNVGGAFVWDLGGADEHTFTNTNESIVVVINGENYTVWFDGFGSLIFSIKKTGNSHDIIFRIGVGFNGEVRKIVKDINGKYIVGGTFTSYNGIPSNSIVRLNQDGSIDNTFNIGTGFYSAYFTSNGVINSIIEDNGKYVIGGFFSSYNGISSNTIIRLNQDGSIDDSFYNMAITMSGIEYILLDGDKYVVGGYSMTTSGTPCPNIIRINQDGSLDNTFDISGSYNGVIYTIIKDNNNKYVIGGTFTSFKYSRTYRILRLNQDGSIDTTFNIGTGFNVNNNHIYSILLDGDKYIVGGQFWKYNDIDVNYLIRINQNGSLDTLFNSNINQSPEIIYKYDNNQYIIGGYNLLSIINYDGSTDLIVNIGSGFNNMVNSLILNDNDIIVGGTFTTYNSVIYNRIINLKYDGSVNTIAT